jgi:peroxidase
MKMSPKVLAIALTIIFVSFTGGQCYGEGELQIGFYKGKCGFLDVETIVASIVRAKFFRDPTIAAHSHAVP